MGAKDLEQSARRESQTAGKRSGDNSSEWNQLKKPELFLYHHLNAHKVGSKRSVQRPKEFTPRGGERKGQREIKKKKNRRT